MPLIDSFIALVCYSPEASNQASFLQEKLDLEFEQVADTGMEDHHLGFLSGVILEVLKLQEPRLGPHWVPVFRTQQLMELHDELLEEGTARTHRVLDLGNKRVAGFVDPDGREFRLLAFNLGVDEPFAAEAWEAEEEALVQGVLGVVYYSPEPARLAAFFSKFFALEFAETQGEAGFVAQLGAQQILILPVLAGGSAQMAPHFAVSDWQASLARCEERGLVPIFVSTERRYACFKDADGRLFQLSEAERGEVPVPQTLN